MQKDEETSNDAKEGHSASSGPPGSVQIIHVHWLTGDNEWRFGWRGEGATVGSEEGGSEEIRVRDTVQICNRPLFTLLHSTLLFFNSMFLYAKQGHYITRVLGRYIWV